MTTESKRMTEAWRRLDAWFGNNAPAAAKALHPGADDDLLNAYEQLTEQELPEDVRQWFRIHNGQADPYRPNFSGLIFGLQILSLKESFEQWKANQGPPLTEEIDYAKTFPPNAIRIGCRFPGWIPLTQDAGGNFLGVDLNPGPAGHRGQVINFGSDEIDKFVVASSWAEIIELVATEYERSKVEYEADSSGYWIGHHKDFPTEKNSSSYVHFHNALRRLHEAGKFNDRHVVFDGTMIV